MVSGFVIMLRETLEASLIVGIIMGFLIKTDQKQYVFQVIMGIIAGIIASIFGAVIFNRVAGGFSGRSEQLFEGITMIFGSILITTMVLWMMNQKNIAENLEKDVSKNLKNKYKHGLFFLTFISVFREGIESVIFLSAASFIKSDGLLVGAVLGITSALFLGYLIFLSSMKIDVKKFFTISGLLLIFFAAGLISYGVHELQEAHAIPQLVENVWDINPELKPDGSYPLFHEKGYIGAILKELFGYNGNPSLLEVIVYLVYLLSTLCAWIKNVKYQTLQKRITRANFETLR